MKKLPSNTPELKRILGLPLITLYGIGGIIGAGIYVLIGKIVATAGMLAPFSFVIAASIALFSALSYAELSSRYPGSGGEVTFIQQGIKREWISLIVGLAICFGGIVSSAAITRGAAGYLQVYLDVSTITLLTAFLVFIVGFACWGVLESVSVAALITAIEIGGLLFICYIGYPNLDTLGSQTSALFPSTQWSDWAAVFTAALLAFYAYIGFEDMVNMGDEVKNPGRNLPLSILLALGISTLLYFIVSVIFILSVPLDILGQSESPFVDLIQHNSEISPAFITLISLLAISNGALVQIIMSSRILHGMSKHNLVPGMFGRVNERTRTPLFATLFVGAAVFLFASFLELESLAKITSYILLTVFALVNLSLILIKRQQTQTYQPDNKHHGQFTTPQCIPYIGFTLCVALLAVQWWL